MSHPWKTMTCTAMLGLTLLAPPVMAAGPPMNETLCHTLGTLTYQAALARDAGLSLPQALQLVARTPAPPSLLGQAFAKVVEVHIRHVYAAPTIDPVTLRQHRERSCVQRGE